MTRRMPRGMDDARPAWEVERRLLLLERLDALHGPVPRASGHGAVGDEAQPARANRAPPVEARARVRGVLARDDPGIALAGEDPRACARPHALSAAGVICVVGDDHRLDRTRGRPE